MDILPFTPNPYANFDPSQWSNPYSQFNNTSIPSATYMGWPTNAQGQPIQPTPGMTLNTTPQAAFGQPTIPTMGAQPASGAAAPASPSATPTADWSAGLFGQSALASPSGLGNAQMMANATNEAMGMTNAMQGSLYGTDTGERGGSPGINTAALTQTLYNAARQQQPQAAPASPAAAPAAPPTGLTSQQYLSLLAHPGYVTTPGATVPPSPNVAQPASGSPGAPGVLQKFLQNWSPAQSGPGSQTAQAFAKALGR